VVSLAGVLALSRVPAYVNLTVGAGALGPPTAATGARITTTLLHALRARGLRRGIASLCIGGGEATAIALETI
jgi:acetyl-CoA C-acetyltransferase